MSATAATDDVPAAGHEAEEGRLALLAARGDGAAFATLYERYERRAYNLAIRISGSEDDAADAVQEAFVNVLRRLPQLEGRELAFGSYLFTATRNACYDLMAKRRRAEPSDAIPETAAPVGAAAGGFGSDPEEDPDRKLLLESQQEEIRVANSRLPERQREVLALRELEELSYDEIAEIMGMNRNSVAQLISRARIRLRDELRGTALAAIAASSPECERALPLIALRDDRQLAEDGADAAWLDGHLAGCDTCRLSVAAMQEAGTSYRAWAPVAAAPFLFRDTLAKAADAAGFDWSETIAARAPAHDPAAYHPSMPPLYRTAVRRGRRRRALWIAGGLGAAALLALAVAVADGGDAPAPRPAAETVGTPAPATTGAPEPAVADPAARKRKAKQARQPGPAADAAPAPAAPDTPTASPPAAGAAPGPAPRVRTRPDGRRQQPAVRRPSPPASVPPVDTTPPPAAQPEPPAEPPPAEPPPTDPPVREPPMWEPPDRRTPPTRYPGLPVDPPR